MTAGIIALVQAEVSEVGWRLYRSFPGNTWRQKMCFLTLKLIRTHRKGENTGLDEVTWSWWSKKVLMHALEPASHTFTLLSDELRGWKTFLKQLYTKTAIEYKAFNLFVLPGDKVGVVWGEGNVQNPGTVSTQRSGQVGMLPSRQTKFIIVCTNILLYTFNENHR